MHKFFWTSLVLAAVGLYGWSAMSQPPADERGSRRGPPRNEDFDAPPGPPNAPPPPRPWQPGKIMPPHVQHDLALTDDQKKQLAALEDEVKGRILAILTSEQKDQLADMRDRDPGPPPEEFGPPPDDQGPPPPRRHARRGPPRDDQGPGGPPKQ